MGTRGYREHQRQDGATLKVSGVEGRPDRGTGMGVGRNGCFWIDLQVEPTGFAGEGCTWGSRATLRMRGSPVGHVFVESLSAEMTGSVATKFMTPSEVWHVTTQDSESWAQKKYLRISLLLNPCR